MVVLAASIVTKTGKVLVSRQFVEMTRIRIEGLLAAFPKLVGSGKQHTYIETENVRYVYQPLESLYLLLITNKQSNIVADLDTLRLLSKVIPEYAQPVEEETVSAHVFDLIFAFDEVISLGYKENITVQQVRQNTAMESHEEKLHKMIIETKINDTKAVMQQKAQEIEKSKVEKGQAETYKLPAMAGSDQLGKSSSYGDMDSGPNFSAPADAPPSRPASKPSRARAGGMQLGKKKHTNDFMAALQAEGEAVEMEAAEAPKRSAGGAGPAAAAPVARDPVQIDIEERLSVVLSKDGGIEKFEVQGTMVLMVNDPSCSTLRVELATGQNKGFQFKTHPNIDKQLYSKENVLGLKDPNRPFPQGSALGVLKWRYLTNDEDALPITINCWPSVSGNECYVNIEYESRASYDLSNVVIAIPAPQSPQVNSCDGDWRFDSRTGRVLWEVELVDDSNRDGAMEFVLPGTDVDAVFPVEVTFETSETLCDIDVAALVDTSAGSPIKYAMRKALTTDHYEVV